MAPNSVYSKMLSFKQKASLKSLTREINKSGLSGENADPTDDDNSRIVASSSNLDSAAGLASSRSNIPNGDHPVNKRENLESLSSDNDRTQLIYTPAASSTGNLLIQPFKGQDWHEKSEKIE